MKRIFETTFLMLFIMAAALIIAAQDTKPTKTKVENTQTSKSAETLFAEGVKYKQAGQFEKAVESYREAIRLKPNFWEAYYNLAITFWTMKRYKDAEDAIRNSIRINPDESESYMLLGNIYDDSARTKPLCTGSAEILPRLKVR